VIERSTLINPERVLQVNAGNFENIALQVFNFQYTHNDIYRKYCDALHVKTGDVDRLSRIPFLPISFFKTHRVWAGGDNALKNAALVFESSGTTGELTSRHYIRDGNVYETSLLQGFEAFYGAPGRYAILALLPSYLERKNASLVHMAKTLMEKSGHPDNGFYVNEWARLHDTLMRLEQSGQKILLIGVTFALLDFADAYPGKLANTIVMETGGMKGRRREWTRTEVHETLKDKWQLPGVHSEYGMTELLSQAYAVAKGVFKCTNTMKVMVRDINDPLDTSGAGYGCLNIIDLANIYSCSFIATEDLGHVAADSSFEVLGRMDHSALRGCSLMAV
jgi:hypothetical protein